MVNELGATGAALGLTTSSALITQGVTAVERLLGVSDVAAATDMALVEAAARWQAWLAAEAASANDKEVRAGATGLKLSERFEHIQVRLARTEGAYYSAKATADAAAGTGGFFAFSLACGGRGR